eukprot:TRINITY_DN29803_c0_g1_i1.p1 TRINITY_DN29803_c0_g1~~TRINITY_DN29803_c0_g1_i1.p1  ORF type:complete len:224 (-),score=32.21 TRINITY_DN29803_c0_g1_i1:186-857(-)
MVLWSASLVISSIAGSAVSLLYYRSAVQDDKFFPVGFDVVDVLSCLVPLALVSTGGFQRLGTACCTLRICTFLYGIYGYQAVAAAVGLLDLLFTREKLFVELRRNIPEKAWVAGATKACLVVDVNARLLAVFGLNAATKAGAELPLWGEVWIYFVLFSYVASVLLMSKSSDAYCAVIGVALVGLSVAPEAARRLQIAAGLGAVVSFIGFSIIVLKENTKPKDQ